MGLQVRGCSDGKAVGRDGVKEGDIMGCKKKKPKGK